MQTTLDSIRDIKLYQSKSGYRFSVDALLLYSFVNLKVVKKIADLGAGSGIVGLLLAKRYSKAEVMLVELQESLFKLLEKNIVINNLQDRVSSLKCDIRKLPEGLGGFDLVVSNPPFRKPFSGRLNIEEEKAIARHEIKLSLGELVGAASRLLKSKGRFLLVYHPLRLYELMNELKKVQLEPKRLRFVHGRSASEAKMVLLEAVKHGRAGIKIEPPLFVYNEDGSYTDEMKKIYG
jgi:tRNA1Val (adenine37-N6)-methyltransferase